MYNTIKKEAAMLLGLTERSGSTYRRWEPAPFLFSGKNMTPNKKEKKMIKDRIIPIIEERESTDDEWDYGVEQCHKKLIELMTEDINMSIQFLDNDCTADQFSWLSEVFDEIAEITQSKEFIEALKRLAIKYPEETKTYNIMSFIESAEGAIFN